MTPARTAAFHRRPLTAAWLALGAALLAGPAGAQSSCNEDGGIAAGCTAARPYSCPAAGLCYAALDRCEQDPTCAPGADTCNPGGVAPGCTPGAPFSCGAAASCYQQLASCIDTPSCPGALQGPTTCNVKGVAPGCTAALPFACPATDGGACHPSLSACTASAACPGAVGFTDAGTTCNTAGVAYGCPATLPYSCQASATCHPDAPACGADPACPGKPGGGGTAAVGWAPALALLVLVPRRRRMARRGVLD